METILNILLYVGRRDQPLPDRIFWAVVSGSVVVLLSYLIARHNRKKLVKKQDEDALRQEVVMDILLARELFNDHPFKADDDTLYAQMKEKCNPANFLEPYDAKKVEVSNDIYSKLDAAKNNEKGLMSLRNRAIAELGVTYENPALYEKLSALFNPQNFVGDNYDAEKLRVANKYYAKVQKYKENLIELERIYYEINASDIKDSKRNIKDSKRDRERKTTNRLFWAFFILVLLLSLLA